MMIIRLSIQKKDIVAVLVRPNTESPETNVGMYRILSCPDVKVIEERILGRPKPWIIYTNIGPS